MSFSLLTQPWLPMVANDGSNKTASLNEVLLNPLVWAGLDAAHPLECLAGYRFLLAICHRSIGPGTIDDRADLIDIWPAALVETYLQQWADRFDLFDAARPFLQHPGIDNPELGLKSRPLTVLRAESVTGNNRTLWDRSFDSNPTAFTPAEIARTLLAHQQFTPGGLIRAIRPSGTRGAANGLQLVVPQSSNLQQTLAINLLPQTAAEHAVDLPCWERELVETSGLHGKPERVPAGPADRYTFPVRVVLLQSETHMLYGPGEIIGDSPLVDPMTAVVQGKDKSLPLFLREGRMLWRDATALVGAAGSTPPAVIANAAEIQMALDSYEPVELLAGGLLCDKAKYVLWRLEQRHLAPALVGNPEAQAVVEEMIKMAEASSKSLYGATSTLCRQWLSNGGDGTDPAPADVKSLRTSMQPDVLFWGALETEFWGATHVLGTGAIGEVVLISWRDTIRQTVLMVWDHCCNQIGTDGRGLQARGRSGPALAKCLKGLAPIP